MRTFRATIISLLAFAALGKAAEPLRVSSFSTVLTEIAQQVGGTRAAVTGHVRAGVDPHDYEPTPGDLKIVSSAQLILISAKHLENYVDKLKEAAGAQGRVVAVGDGFSSLRGKAEGAGSTGAEDPHWWQSIGNMEAAVRIVRDAFIALSPGDTSYFGDNAARYEASLAALQKWARTKIAELPRNRRKLVTSHDAFQYFARDFGFTIYAIEGVSPEDQPSSKKVEDLIATIKSQGVKAIFLEKIENPKVLTEITRETGAKVGGELYADGLGAADSSAATYEGMYRHNVTTIVDALK